jgi:iron(III) transport system substrate-binding protein
MKHRRSAWLAVCSSLAIAASAAGAQPTLASTPDDTSSGLPDLSGASLVIYSGRNEEFVQPFVDRFVSATGADVEVRYGNSAEMGAALMEEGDNTPADVFYSQEASAVGPLARAELLVPLPDDVVELVDERYRPTEGNLWVGVTGRSRVIVYNPNLVTEVPTTTADLTDPQYEGEVAFVPGNASFQTFVTAFRVTAGEDAARQWLEDMIANGAITTYESNGDVLAAVNAGEVPIGLINHYYWAQLLDEVGPEGMTAELVFPDGDDPGALVMATAVAITAHGADNPAALAFVEYMLTPEGQSYFAGETFEYPLVEGVPGPEGVPPLDDLEGPALDQTDLDSIEATQQLLTEVGLLS